MCPGTRLDGPARGRPADLDDDAYVRLARQTFDGTVVVGRDQMVL